MTAWCCRGDKCFGGKVDRYHLQVSAPVLHKFAITKENCSRIPRSNRDSSTWRCVRILVDKKHTIHMKELDNNHCRTNRYKRREEWEKGERKPMGCNEILHRSSSLPRFVCSQYGDFFKLVLYLQNWNTRRFPKSNEDSRWFQTTLL